MPIRLKALYQSWSSYEIVALSPTAICVIEQMVSLSSLRPPLCTQPVSTDTFQDGLFLHHPEPWYVCHRELSGVGISLPRQGTAAVWGQWPWLHGSCTVLQCNVTVINPQWLRSLGHRENTTWAPLGSSEVITERVAIVLSRYVCGPVIPIGTTRQSLWWETEL